MARKSSTSRRPSTTSRKPSSTPTPSRGVSTVASTKTVSPEEQFAAMLKSGEIPLGSSYIGFSSGQIEYSLPPEIQFQKMIEQGNIPKESIYMGYKDGKIQYSLPPEMQFSALLSSGKIPAGSTYEGFENGQIKYNLAPEIQFQNMVTEGTIPKGSVYVGYSGDQIQYKLPPEIQFQQGKSDGTLPSEAIYVGTSSDGSIQYKLPPEYQFQDLITSGSIETGSKYLGTDSEGNLKYISKTDLDAINSNIVKYEDNLGQIRTQINDLKRQRDLTYGVPGKEEEDKALDKSITQLQTYISSVQKEFDDYIHSAENDKAAYYTALKAAYEWGVKETSRPEIRDYAEGSISTLKEYRSQVEAASNLTPSTPSNAEVVGQPIGSTRSLVSRVWQGITPWEESQGQTFGTTSKTLADIARGRQASLTSFDIHKVGSLQISSAKEGVKRMDPAFDILVPGYYTAMNWDDISDTEKGISLALDIVSILPVLGAAGRSAAESTTLTKGARFLAATKGVGAEAVRTITWPAQVAESLGRMGKEVSVVNELGETVVKSGLRAVPENVRLTAQAYSKSLKEMTSGLENIIRPTKLPESVVINTMHSAKIPVSLLGEGKETMALRDAIMTARKEGAVSVAIERADKTFELHSVPLMKKTGGLAHGATDITQFDLGLIVKELPNKPAIEQGLFLAPNPIGRYALGSSASGIAKVKSGIFITSKEYAESFARSSAKLFSGTAELESVIDVGSVLEAPAQKLFTRISGERVEIYLAKALSPTDILKLKAEGLIESVKGLYTPTLEIKGIKNLTGEETEALAKIIGDSDSLVADNIRRVQSAVDRMPTMLPSSVLRESVEGARAYLLDVRTTIDSRLGAETGLGIYSSRSVSEVQRNLGENLNEAITRVINERQDSLGYERSGIGEIVPSRVEGRLDQASALRSYTGNTITPSEGARVKPEELRTSRSIVEEPVGRVGPSIRPETTGRTEPVGREEPIVRAEPSVVRTDIGRTEPVYSKPIRPILDPGQDKFRRLSATLKQGSVSWRQGKAYWLIYPPYGTNDVITSGTPFPGIPEFTGPGSAYKSLTLRGLNLPNVIQHSMGAQNITINTRNKTMKYTSNRGISGLK